MGDWARWQQLIPLFIAAAWCHGPASPFLPATFEPVVMAYGQTHAPALVAVSAALISVVMEGVNYLGYGYVLRSNRLRRIRTASTRLTALFQRWPFLTCLLVAATPLPDWSARILGAMARYSTSRYLAAFMLGRTASFWLLATIGFRFQPPRSWLFIAAAGSIVLTYGTVCLRRLHTFRLRRAGVLVVSLMLSAMPRSLAAQDTRVVQDTLAAQETVPAGDTLRGIKPALGASFERFIYDGHGVSALGSHYSRLEPNTLSTEIAAALFPDALQVGALLLALDFGAAYDVRGTTSICC